MPTESPDRTGIDMRLISSDTVRKQPGMTRVLVTNLGKFGADILPNRSILSKVQLKNRTGLYRYANTEAAYSQDQKQWELVFSTVCLPVTSTLTCRATLSGTRSNLVLGLLATRETYGGVAFFEKESYCICIGWARQLHDAKMTHQGSPVRKVGDRGIRNNKKKQKNRNGGTHLSS